MWRKGALAVTSLNPANNSDSYFCANLRNITAPGHNISLDASVCETLSKGFIVVAAYFAS